MYAQQSAMAFRSAIVEARQIYIPLFKVAG